MIPSCSHMGVPIHFHSSTTSGSASLMSLRIRLKVSPRQSPSSAILLSISSDADWPSVEPDFFMFSSSTSGLFENAFRRPIQASQLLHAGRETRIYLWHFDNQSDVPHDQRL